MLYKKKLVNFFQLYTTIPNQSSKRTNHYQARDIAFQKRK